ncbi:hypothetical protein TUBRATIS_23960 [Tubulinosema ratisbonensis]|uniref:Uncharacterized protein n=1 Tax=Tubulinosema ratisbonensis TaxID=291195 RepID=A0A437AJ02_9MICR|nr:hypothetical protein TUBRATIS_23960 [Tubulinosema ratisbonensis]
MNDNAYLNIKNSQRLHINKMIILITFFNTFLAAKRKIQESSENISLKKIPRIDNISSSIYLDFIQKSLEKQNKSPVEENKQSSVFKLQMPLTDQQPPMNHNHSLNGLNNILEQNFGYDKEDCDSFFEFINKISNNTEQTNYFQSQIDEFSITATEMTEEDSSSQQKTNKESPNTDTNECIPTTVSIFNLEVARSSDVEKPLNVEDEETIYDFNMRIISYDSDYENELELHEFFEESVSMLDKSEIFSFLEILKLENKKYRSSIHGEIKNVFYRNGFKSPFKFFSLNIISLLENRFFLRLKDVLNFYLSKTTISFKVLFKKHGDNKSKTEALLLYNKFICSSFVQNFFSRRFDIPQADARLTSVIPFIINFFNKFFSEYTENVTPPFLNLNFNYPIKYRKLFFSETQNKTNINLLIWVHDLLNNKTNSLLIILFPELKLIIKKIYKFGCIKAYYKKFHYFFALLVFKLNLNLPKIKYEFDKMNKTDECLITDSKFINLFMLEMRCLICTFCLVVFTDKELMKLLFFKAFACFVRSLNRNFLKCFLFDEHSVFNIFKDKYDFIRLNLDDLYARHMINKVSLEAISKCNVITLSDKIIFLEVNFLSEESKLNQLYEFFLTNEYSYSKFISENLNIKKRITNAVKKYFESSNNFIINF